MKTSTTVIGAKPSSSEVITCTAVNATASNETLRCTASTTKRGTRLVRRRREFATPNTTPPPDGAGADEGAWAGGCNPPPLLEPPPAPLLLEPPVELLELLEAELLEAAELWLTVVLVL